MKFKLSIALYELLKNLKGYAYVKIEDGYCVLTMEMPLALEKDKDKIIPEFINQFKRFSGR